jgi:hypothetical protein
MRLLTITRVMLFMTYKEAIVEYDKYDKAIAIDPQHEAAHYYKTLALGKK